jgi:hypothetical protein
LEHSTVKESRGRKRFRVIELPEGYLLLSWVPVDGLLDLKEKSLRLRALMLYIPSGKERIWMQLRREYVRQQLKRIASAARREPFKVYDRTSPVKYEKARRLIAYANAITKALRAWDKIAYVHPDTCRAYNRKMKKVVKKALMKDMGLTRARAREMMRFLIEWWF